MTIDPSPFDLTDLNRQFPLKDSITNRDITNLGDLISVLIPYIFGITGFILLLMIVFSGFQILTSAGNPKAMEAGQKRLVNAIIGFVIIFLSYWIVKLVGQMLGIESITNIFGN
ncbi:pilin [Patescibacteria group bacterium]|nr:pilin [Patescibacteria group bacterium]MBU2036546.1 pilin [Patescibacteria group bacterium]